MAAATDEKVGLAKEINRLADLVEKNAMTEARAEELVERAIKKVQDKLPPPSVERFDKKDLEESVEKIVRAFLQEAVKGGRSLPFPDEGKGLRRVVTFEKAMRRKTRDPDILEFQKAADNIYILGSIGVLAKKGDGWARQSEMYEDFADMRKALSTTGAGTGAEWIPTGFSSNLIERIELATRLWALFPQIKIPLGMDQLVLPLRGTYGTLYLMDQAAAENPNKIIESTPSSAKVTFDPRMFGARYLYSVNMTEDAAVAMVPVMAENLVRVFARGYEDVVLNGDITATHMDADVTAAKDHRRAWNGIRKSSSVIGGASFVDLGGAPTEDTVLSLKDGLGEWAAFPERVIWALGIKAWSKFKRFGSVKTVQNFGESRASIVTGQVADFDGSPVVISPKARIGLNASGVQDGVTTTKTLIHLVALDAWMTADKRQLTIEQDKDIEAGQFKMVGSSRVDFKVIHNVADARPSVVGYNLTS